MSADISADDPKQYIANNNISASQWIAFRCSKCSKPTRRRADHLAKSIDRFGIALCGKCAQSCKSGAGVPKLSGSILTRVCAYCNQEFEIQFGERNKNRQYCSKSCSSKARIGQRDSRKIYKCIVCNREFKAYGNRILCSLKCTSAYMSIARQGKNNPLVKTHPKTVTQCRQCNKQFEYNRGGLHTGQDRVFCSRECCHDFQRGKTKGTWEPSVYNDGYPQEWNSKLRDTIRQRDGNQCVLCLGTDRDQKLSVHHIDRDKTNCAETNLISLCKRCHQLTHTNEPFFETILSVFQSGSIIIRKGWGLEGHIVNHEKYCLKYLVFFKGTQFSLHHHKVKQELWHCLFGKFVCDIIDNNTQSSFTFEKGNKIELLPGVSHRLTALKNSIIVEVSTEDFPEDSIRWIKGD